MPVLPETVLAMLLRRSRAGAAGAQGAAEVLQCCGEGGSAQLEGAAAIRGRESPQKGKGWEEEEGSLVWNINEWIGPPFLGGSDSRSLPGKDACQKPRPSKGGQRHTQPSADGRCFFLLFLPFFSALDELFPSLKAEISRNKGAFFVLNHPLQGGAHLQGQGWALP